MKKIRVLLLFQTINIAFGSVCDEDFEETLCENFSFSPELTLDSATNKLTIKNATGTIIHENFRSLDTITEIKITGSNITGIEPSALCCIPNLTSISIVDNVKFPKITRQVLQNCQRIKKINFDGRELQIDNGAFVHAKKLQSLNINDSVIACNLGQSFFKGLDVLKMLTIRHTNCDKIKSDAFSGLKNLKFLDLQYNEFESIARTGFKGLSQLKVLNLSDNKLKNLTWTEFEDLKALRVLFLENNDFNTVDVDKLLTSVPDLERVFFSYDKLSQNSRKNIEETLPKFNITFIYIGKSLD